MNGESQPFLFHPLWASRRRKKGRVYPGHDPIHILSVYSGRAYRYRDPSKPALGQHQKSFVPPCNEQGPGKMYEAGKGKGTIGHGIFYIENTPRVNGSMSHGCGLKFIHEPLLLHRKSTNLAELALIQCLSPSRVPGYAGNPLKDGGGRLRTAGSRIVHSAHSIDTGKEKKRMFTLNFHYEDVSRQDPLLKPNHANVMEVPGSCKIRVVPKAAPSDFIIKNGKLAMEIPCGQKLIQTQRASTGKEFRSNPFLGKNQDKKGYVSDLARQSTLRGHGMSHFLVRISAVMSLLDFPVEIREKSIQFLMEMEFCEFSPELEDHFEIFEHIRGFNVTIVTSANTQDETLPPWSGFFQKDEGESQ
ncbi:unnamed protein product [Lactuca virosa]|nr:unnamed protein product [Lactuca virosa]CAI9260396.1 unnamed protein product [Lactuca saligna]CAI9261640.1 unnamed protein product [Lactuca saligna]CAI9262834.1 unnamed protein product [Lactuca saligna]CAI9264517.1 unnamed protein product [Lactuca saligna]